MKNYQILMAGLLLFLSSCAVPSYFGDKLAPTTSVDLFYSTHDVTKPYRVIGHLNFPNGNQDEVKEQLIAAAKKVGADAIVITGSTVNNGGRFSSDVVNAEALKYTN
jgi:hypothetical protein